MPKHRTEEVVQEVHQAVEMAKNGQVSDQLFGKVHSMVEDSDVAPDLKNYESHQWIRLEDIDISVDTLCEILEKESKYADEKELVELQTLVKQLQGRKSEIRSAIRRYVSTLIQFNITNRHRDRMEYEDFRDKMIEIDHARRRNHNALLDVLRTYDSLIRHVMEEGYITKQSIHVWTPDETFRHNTPGTITAFGGDVIDNRELVRRWATAASVSTALHIVDEQVEKRNGAVTLKENSTD